MEDTKKEELKKILENSMKTDHFEKHRVERENIQEEEKEEESYTNNINMDALKPPKKEINTNRSSLLLPFFVLLSILLFTAIIFLFNRQNEILASIENKETQIKEVIIKEKIIEKTPKKESIIEIKEEEPNTIKIEEVKKAALVEKKETKKEEIVEKPLKSNESNDFKKVVKQNFTMDEKPLEIKANPEVAQEVSETKPLIKEIKIVDKNLTKDKFRDYYNASEFKKLTCYDYNAGAIYPTNKCKIDMKKFLEQNKNALRVEVIAVIAEEDIDIFEGIEKTRLSNYSTPQRLKKYAIRGLARDRVLESTWYVKDTLGTDAIITPTNYYVTSKKNNKGILIKAYH